MAYSNGTANSFADLQVALVSACTAQGWAWSDNILSKGNVFVQLESSATALTATGGTGVSGGVLQGATPRKLQIRRLNTGAAPVITWPVNYETFIFDNEVYFVVQHDDIYFLYMAFGQSTIAMPGTGMWVSASVTDYVNNYGIHITPDAGGASSYTSDCPGIFYATYGSGENQGHPYYVHCGLDGRGWNQDFSNTTYAGASAPGILSVEPFNKMLPNQWNSEGILLPMRCYAFRPSSKTSVIADLKYARHTRIDNFEPGQVITIGTDKWKIFPNFCKNATARDGGGRIYHTGTFGWAVRYEGA